MSTDARSEQDRTLVEEGMKILSAHMPAAKVAQFIIAMRRWDGINYADERDRMFENLTVDELFEQIRKFQEHHQG